MTLDKIITSITLFLVKNRPNVGYRNYFIGRTDNIEETLYGFHHVKKGKDLCITFTANDSDVAIKVIEHFHTLGMETDDDKNIPNAVHVYCYEIGMHTKERD